jgi:hypothetical protein
MTLPNRPRNTVLPGSTSNATPAILTPEELTAIVDADYQHVDYNLHPLSVQGLDHYIESPEGDDRFHIS